MSDPEPGTPVATPDRAPPDGPAPERAALRPDEACLALLFLALAVACRFWGLAEQGLRFPDEGIYALFGMAIAEGTPESVYYKPLQGLLLALAFRLLAVTQFLDFTPLVFLLPAACVGFATVAAFGVLARRTEGAAASILALGSTAGMPYLLLYHRSALSEPNYFALVFLATVLMLRSIPDGLPGAAARRPGAWAAVSGAVLGLSFWVNPATAAPTVGLAAGWIALALQGRLPRRPLLACFGLWVLAGLATAALVFGALRLFPWYEPRTNVALIGFVGQVAAESRWTWAPFSRLAAHAGPVFCVLAAAGAAASLRRRAPLDVVLLALAAVLLAFGVRSAHPWPRLYLAGLLPLTLFAARAGGLCAEEAARRAGRPGLRIALAGVLGALCLAGQAREALAMMSLKSGYMGAVEALVGERQSGRRVLVASPQSSNLLVAFSIPANAVTEPIAVALALPGGAERAEELLRDLRLKGYTHLLLDSLFRLELREEGVPELRRFLERNPPWRTLLNPAGVHAETVAESDMQPLTADPLSAQIRIFRLDRLGTEEK